MNRRDFFKKMATAAVVATVAPKILAEASMPAAPLTFTVSNAPPAAPLTFAQLEETYQMLMFGREEPDLIAMAPDVYAKFLDMLPMEERFVGPDNCQVFNGAAVTHSKYLAPGTYLEINSMSTNPRMSGMFEVGSTEWKPVPENPFADLHI